MFKNKKKIIIGCSVIAVLCIIISGFLIKLGYDKTINFLDIPKRGEFIKTSDTFDVKKIESKNGYRIESYEMANDKRNIVTISCKSNSINEMIVNPMLPCQPRVNFYDENLKEINEFDILTAENSRGNNILYVDEADTFYYLSGVSVSIFDKKGIKTEVTVTLPVLDSVESRISVEKEALVALNNADAIQKVFNIYLFKKGDKYQAFTEGYINQPVTLKGFPNISFEQVGKAYDRESPDFQKIGDAYSIKTERVDCVNVTSACYRQNIIFNNKNFSYSGETTPFMSISVSRNITEKGYLIVFDSTFGDIYFLK